MAKSQNQKLKLLYLMDILKKYSDEMHGLTLNEIIDRLRQNNIEAERKSLYDDIEMLNHYGFTIEKEKKNRTWRYFHTDRNFSLAETKLLVDTVWASRFLTQKKSRELTKKLAEELSTYDAQSIRRQTFVSDRIKHMNESILYTVDSVHNAIAENRRIDFDYLEWNDKKMLQLRKNGEKKDISPWALLWDNTNYYLVAYDPEKEELRHYRVDKMKNIRFGTTPREGKALFEKKEPEQYSRRRFQMFDGEPEQITLTCAKPLLGTLIDHFGTDVGIRSLGDEQYELHVQCALTPVFLGWLLGLGPAVRIVSPPKAVAQTERMLRERMIGYKYGQIRNVIFDLGMVLVDFRYREYMKELGFDESTVSFFEKNIILCDIWRMMDRGDKTQEDAVKFFLERYPNYERAIRKFFYDTTRLVLPYSDVEAWIRDLKEHGYRVYILSNYPAELFDVHKSCFGFLSLVDGCVISAEEHLAKPEPEIYERLLSRFGLKAVESVFLDDRKENVEGAEACGIHGILVGDRKAAQEELRIFLHLYEQ